MISLSIGCGGNKQYPHSTLRDINLDLYLPIRKIENFVLADAQHLPFKQKTTGNILASHIIEHLDDPQAFLKEALRICEGSIQIIVPNYLEWAAYQDKTHKWVFAEGRIYRLSHIMRMVASFTIRFKHLRRLLQRFLGKSYADTVLEVRQ